MLRQQMDFLGAKSGKEDVPILTHPHSIITDLYIEILFGVSALVIILFIFAPYVIFARKSFIIIINLLICAI